jgi:membrane protein DedA with SNARE-associated domain
MQIFDQILTFIEHLAYQIPLELFVIIGSFIEEILAPIPSPIVMVLAGSLAHAQEHSMLYLLWLALFGAIGKTAGAYILYFVADKLEDVVIQKFGKYVGVTHKEIESIGKKLNGGWQDNVFLFLARALPIIPSAPVSLGCGIIKINRKTFITSTFAGTYVRDLLYLYLGYLGLGNYKEIADGFEGIESIGKILLFVVLAGVVVWAYLHRRKHKS